MALVEVYTTRTCGYCVRAKELLARNRIPYREIDVSQDDRARKWLLEMTGGQRTVPQIFIDGQPIGGYRELAALEQQGALARLREPVAGSSK
jgi:glutaredoxin 3